MSLLSYVERTFYFFSMWLRWSAFGTYFVLIVVSIDRCGLSLFYFLVSWETSRFFLFFSPLCVTPWKKVREHGEIAAYGCNVGLAASSAWNASVGGGIRA